MAKKTTRKYVKGAKFVETKHLPEIAPDDEFICAGIRYSILKIIEEPKYNVSHIYCETMDEEYSHTLILTLPKGSRFEIEL